MYITHKKTESYAKEFTINANHLRITRHELEKAHDEAEKEALMKEYQRTKENIIAQLDGFMNDIETTARENKRLSLYESQKHAWKGYIEAVTDALFLFGNEDEQKLAITLTMVKLTTEQSPDLAEKIAGIFTVRLSTKQSPELAERITEIF